MIKFSEKPLKIVLTGVENSGKTTLSVKLSRYLNWPLIPELCRENDDVNNQITTIETLEEIQNELTEIHENSSLLPDVRGVIFDTGSLELEMWAEIEFSQSLNPPQKLQSEVDLYVLCSTIPDWEPDPLRNMPLYSDRIFLENKYKFHLKSRSLPFIVLPVISTDSRMQLVIDELKTRFNV